MRQTLLYIPHEAFGVPLFGFGWALAAWFVASAALVAALVRRQGWGKDVLGHLSILAIFGLVIYAVLPHLEVKPPGLEPLGLPIRGYGVFVLAGVVAGVALSAWRGRQVGIDPELIYSLALWMFALGIGGARLFYVIQKWPEFDKGDLPATIGAILKFTEGGLVVYGAVFGGILAVYVFSRRHRLSMLELGDVIAPSMALGLAFGRIGCLMNGCCYGGVCESLPLAMTFPRLASAELQTFSPPYAHQLATGLLYGFTLRSDADQRPVVASVEPGGKAEQAGLRAGRHITRINGLPVSTLADAQRILVEGPSGLQLSLVEAEPLAWLVGPLPERTRPIHPTQIYSSINAALICLVGWFAFPFRRRQGDVLIGVFAMYAPTRFLLEAIRDDEGGQWGTSLTISQLVCLLVLTICLIAWFLPRPRVRPEPTRST